MPCCCLNGVSHAHPSLATHSPQVKNAGTALLVVTGIALAIIGMLALLGTPGLAGCSDLWYLFGLATIVCIVAAIICCVKSRSSPTKENRVPAPPPPTLPPQTQPFQPFNASNPSQVFLAAQRNAQAGNCSDAFQLYTAAWSQGFHLAGFSLAECYAQGFGVPQDENGALFYYDCLARNNNYLEAIYWMACRSFSMNNFQEGAQWLNSALAIEKNPSRQSFISASLLYGQENDATRAVFCAGVTEQYVTEEWQMRMNSLQQWMNGNHN